MASGFAHLHVHTEFSMLDGAAKHDALFAEVARLEQPAVAMTDHGNMFGAHSFYTRARAAGIKPIIGIEAYVAPESRHHKKPVFWGNRATEGKTTSGDGSAEDVAGGGAYTHMTLLAQNATGLRNLFTLSSLASMEGQYRKPRMDRELISEYADGIIATTGCLGGEVLTRLRLGQKQEALTAAAEWADIFGPDRFFVEVMDHGIALERTLRTDLLDVARQLDLPVVATNDSHYVTAEQAQHHDALLCVQVGKTLQDTDRFRFDGGGYHLKSAAEMRDYFDTEVPGACDATLQIAEMIEDYGEVFAEVDRRPQAQITDGRSDVEVLRAEVEQHIPSRFPDGIPQRYRDQLDWELQVIADKGYSSYFLVVGDIVRWAKQQGIRVGPGRGSAAGALLSYVLHIIDIDPIAHGLLFERFLNPERNSPPDIDIDFDDRRRGEVIAYAKRTYGEEYVAKVVTYGTIKTKAAFKDAARVHHGTQGFALADRFSKALPPQRDAEDIPLSGIVDPNHERYAEAAEVRGLVEADSTMAQIFDTARGLEGLVRNAGVHACAHIISREPLLDVLPLWRRDDGETITGFDGPQCEAIGLLKVDILGVSNLTVINDAVQMIQNNHGVTIDPLELPLDDPDTYALLARGESVGVFQIEGSGMRELLKRMRPTEFGDVVAANALYRPGPLDVHAHLDYADRKNGRKPAAPIEPTLGDALEPILGDTHGLIVYQEQVMRIAQELAGYTLGQADSLRKAMGKKKKDVLEAEEAKFADGMARNGYSRESARTLWATILPFAGYAFNKSHAAAYGLITYWTAWLKTHYPAEYMAGLLTTASDNKDKTALYLAECRRMGLTVLPPDVNESDVWFTAVDGRIRFGLAAIRGLGTGVAKSMIRTRREQGSFTSFADVLTKADRSVCTKRVIDALIKAGGFDAFGTPRQALAAVHADAVEAMTTLKKHQEHGQDDLFSTLDTTPADDVGPLAHLRYGTDEWPRKHLLANERDMLGLYVSAHPLDGAEAILRQHAPKAIATLLDDAPKDGEVAIAGLITSVERKTNRKGEPWAIVRLDDLDAAIDVLVFAKAHEVLGAELIQDSAVAVKGRINWRDDQMSVVASDLVTLDVSLAEHGPAAEPAPPLVLRADANRVCPDTIAQLKGTLVQHRGTTPVRVIITGQREQTLDLPDYPVTSRGAVQRELKGIPGLTVI